jgi:DNA topoisomerase-3
MVRTESVEAKGLKTRPPARYSEATLLGAMEGAGKFVEDDELREAMAEKGSARRPRARPSSKA